MSRPRAEPWRPDEVECRLPAAAARRLAAVCLAVGLALLGAAWLSGPGVGFWRSYYLALCFWLSLSLGALFFVLLHHLVNASWSVVVRRVAEALAVMLPLLLVVFLPFAAAGGRRLLVPVGEAPAAAPGEGGGLLGPHLASLRGVLYLALWSALALLYWRNSVAQDASGEAAFAQRSGALSGPAMLVYGVSVPLAGADFLMTLHERWQSTIFGIYFFSGCVVGALALLTLALMALQAGRRLRRAVSVEHYHDLGKLLFAFVFFWAYLAYCQHMTIWYADLPEETRWFQLRAAPRAGPGNLSSLALLFGHWLLPFLALLSREVKRRKALLGFWCAWLLAMHYADLRWLAAPEWGARGPAPSLPDVACLAGLGALYLGGALWVACRHALLPLQDDRLEESLAFENQ